jgi:hypothetical protein
MGMQPILLGFQGGIPWLLLIHLLMVCFNLPSNAPIAQVWTP